MLPFLLSFSIALPWLYGLLEAWIDNRKIKADAAKNQDSLKEGFHAFNLIRRASVGIGFTAALTFALSFYGFAWWVGVAYFGYFTAAFGYAFTVCLNLLREPAVPKWYVSTDARAAQTDRLFVKYAAKFGVTPAALARITYTAAVVLFFGIYAVAVWEFC